MPKILVGVFLIFIGLAIGAFVLVSKPEDVVMVLSAAIAFASGMFGFILLMMGIEDASRVRAKESIDNQDGLF